MKLKLGLATPGEKGKTTTVRSDCSLIEARFTFEAYIEIKAGIVIPVEFRIALQFDLVSTDPPDVEPYPLDPPN